MGVAYTLVVLVVLRLASAGSLMSRPGEDSAAPQDAAGRDSVLYHVPNGQDPAAVLVTLAQGGFDATTDPGDSHTMRIPLPLGPQQREELRALLENHAGQTLDPQDHTVPGGPVRFADES